MLTRLVLALVLVISVTACKSKAPNKATAPGNQKMEAGGESAPAPDSDKKEDDSAPGTSTKGDPCDGGEVTPKKK